MLTITLLLAMLAFVQDQPTTALGLLAFAALQPVLGWIGTKLYDGLKTLFPWWDRLPSIVHQVAAPILQFVFGFIANATGAAFLTDVHAISGGWIGGILTLLLSQGIKRYEKSKTVVDATAVLAATRTTKTLKSIPDHERPPSGRLT